MALMMDDLMMELSPRVVTPHAKVTVVGTGAVGMAAAFSIMTQGVASELCLVDIMEDKLKGEMMDLQHGQAFIPKCKIQASSDYSISAGSAICVVTAGARQQEGESRLNLVQRNVNIMKGIIPKLVQHSPDCILVIVSNPVDILTYCAWKLSGLPRHRVIGTGTMLDSSRFRFLISQKVHVAPQSCHAYIIGEHGDSSVPVWSAANIGGVRLSDKHPNIGVEAVEDNCKWLSMHKEVIDGAYQVIKLKGYTSWAIGLTISTLCGGILANKRAVYPLSTLVQGCHGITDEVFLSLPAVVGETGITHIFKMDLNELETKKLQESARTMAEVLAGVEF